MDNRIRLLERLKLKLNGYVYIGDSRNEGWSDSLPLYLFRCPQHGLVKNVARGHAKNVQCPICLEELKSDTADFLEESIQKI